MNIDFGHTLKYKEHLMKYVEVEIVGKKAQEGWLQCIDPLTGNLILARGSNDNSDEEIIVIVTGHSIKSLEVKRESGEDMKDILQNFTNEKPNITSEEDVSERKKRLTLWLKKNRLPFHETDDGEGFVICDSVTIHPPFTADKCVSMNGRVLMMVQKLVADLPDEMKEDVKVKTEK